MALLCSVVLSTNAYSAGSTPAPQATILVENRGASSVVVMGVQLTGRVMGSSTLGNPTTMNNALPPYGPGAPVLVTAGGFQRVGPFAITVGSAANANGGNPQPTQVPVYVLLVGAVVLGSDRSITNATEAGMTVSWPIRPRQNTQGGTLDFSKAANAAGWFF